MINPKKNGTLCIAKTTEEEWTETEDFKLCQNEDYELNFCYESEGSHQKTFWIYFAIHIGTYA